MSPTTYTATIRDGRVEWDGVPPPTNGGPLRVHVTLIESEALTPEQQRQRRLAATLDRLAASGVAEKFGDPVEWQREQRRDKPLSGREDG